MNDIQTDLSENALVAAIRANLCEFYRHLNRSFPETYFENEKFTRWCASIAHPWFNGVLSSLSPEKGAEAFIEETILYFRGKGIGAFTWWMDPSIPSADWQPVLAKYGFNYSDDTPGMAVDLKMLSNSQAVDGLEVRVVADEETLRTWAHIFTTGYGLPVEWEPAAGIYSVATLPEARGKGIGAAVTFRPLHNAREMGYRIGVLQSSELGYNVYKKLGFRHLCQIEYFHLTLH